MITVTIKTPVEEVEKKLNALDTEKYLQMSLDSLKNKNIKEDLDSDITELPPTEEQIDNAFDSIIRNELSKLFLTIDDYNSDIATLKAEEADEEMIKVLDTILDDLNLHVGLLQRLLNE